MISKSEVEKYSELSPFEVKDILITEGKKAVEKAQAEGKKCRLLNSGRGNPNFLNTTVREAFDFLSLFASDLAGKGATHKDLGFRPIREGITKKFEEFMQKHNSHKGAVFLKKAFRFAIDSLSFNSDDFVFEMTDAALGDFYPMPPRIFPHVEKIVREYLFDVLYLEKQSKRIEYDLFATEGATAAMIYIFHALDVNGILKKKERVALITPIFSPYLEIPKLHEYDLEEIYLETTESNEWQLSDSEIEKLKDPNIKALFFVNPTNPTSVAIHVDSLKKIANLVRTERPDLIILTDTVYATFVEHFHSLMNEIPQNMICVYSYSKYFGVTGWRLGTIMLAKDNVIDKLIAKLPKEMKQILHERYATVTDDPDNYPFIHRIVADSREEALAHTGGLSCPQQAIMTLFSLFNLMDKEKEYKTVIRNILKKRIRLLYQNLELKLPEDGDHSYYYTLLDIRTIAVKKYGTGFSDFLEKDILPLQFFFDLAQKKYTICLPGKGFHGPDWSLRISLANLNDADYVEVGKNIKDLLDEYYQEWKRERL